MASTTPQQRVKQFPNTGLKVEDKRLYCGFCHEFLDYAKKSTISNHVDCKSHKKKQAAGKVQPPLASAVNRQIENRTTWASMASTFVATGIPLNVFNVGQFRGWMRDNLRRGESLPSSSTLRRLLVGEGSDDLTITKNQCKGKDVIIMVDETADIKNRKTVNILIAPAEPHSQFRLFNVKFLDKCDGSTIIQFIIRSLNLIDVSLTSVIALVSDNAAYMLTAGKTLLLTNPRCIHTTCWAHVLHIVAEDIRGSLELADELISKVKASLVKSNSRRTELLEILKKSGKETKLPPTPVLTRWTTWLQTGNYHHGNFQEIKTWISATAADSVAIKKLKTLIQNEDLRKELEAICLVYSGLSSTIKTLEKNNLPASDVWQLLNTIRGILELSPFLEAGLEKLDLYLSGKHPSRDFWNDAEFLDPRKQKFIGTVELPHSLKLFSINEIPLAELVTYKNIKTTFVPEDNFCPFMFWNRQKRDLPNLSAFALTILSIPGTSAEVERSFSMLNRLQTPVRSSFTIENLNIHLRLKFNNRANIAGAFVDEELAENGDAHDDDY